MLAAAAACSGSDPCAFASKDFVFTAARGDGGATLSWTAVAGAKEYEIWAFASAGGNAFQNPVATISDLEAGLLWDDALGTLRLEVHPLLGGAVCRAPAGSIVVPPQPALSAEITDNGVQLSWSADAVLAPGAQIQRGSSSDELAALATAPGSSYLDVSAADVQTYTYAVQLSGENLVAVSKAVTLDTLLAAPTVTATDTKSGVLLTVTAPPGATTCTEETTGLSAAAGTTILAPCAAGAVCNYSVRCSDTRGHHSHPATASGQLAP